MACLSFHPHHILLVRPQVSDFTFLTLSFLLCKIDIKKKKPNRVVEVIEMLLKTEAYTLALEQRQFCPTEGIWQCLEAFFSCHNWERAGY